MRLMRNSVLLGLAAAATVGLAGMAYAGSPARHVLTVQLPGGGVETIRYSGNVPPVVVLRPAQEAANPFAMADTMFSAPFPFARLNAIAAEMDREMNSLLRQVRAFAAPMGMPGPGGLTPAALGTMPPGAQSYSFVSTLSGHGVCSRSVVITRAADGGAPKVVRHQSGDCHGGGADVPAALPTAPARPHRPDTVLASARGTASWAGLLRNVADRQ